MGLDKARRAMVAGLPVPITIGRTTQNNHKRSHIKGTFILGVFLIEGATYLLQKVLNKNRATTFVIIDEVETDNWGIAGKQVSEIINQEH